MGINQKIIPIFSPKKPVETPICYIDSSSSEEASESDSYEFLSSSSEPLLLGVKQEMDDDDDDDFITKLNFDSKPFHKKPVIVINEQENDSFEDLVHDLIPKTKTPVHSITKSKGEIKKNTSNKRKRPPDKSKETKNTPKKKQKINENTNEKTNQKIKQKTNQKTNKINEKTNEKTNQKANQKTNKKINETTNQKENKLPKSDFSGPPSPDLLDISDDEEIEKVPSKDTTAKVLDTPTKSVNGNREIDIAKQNSKKQPSKKNNSKSPLKNNNDLLSQSCLVPKNPVQNQNSKKPKLKEKLQKGKEKNVKKNQEPKTTDPIIKQKSTVRKNLTQKNGSSTITKQNSNNALPKVTKGLSVNNCNSNIPKKLVKSPKITSKLPEKKNENAQLTSTPKLGGTARRRVGLSRKQRISSLHS